MIDTIFQSRLGHLFPLGSLFIADTLKLLRRDALFEFSVFQYGGVPFLLLLLQGLALIFDLLSEFVRLSRQFFDLLFADVDLLLVLFFEPFDALSSKFLGFVRVAIAGDHFVP